MQAGKKALFIACHVTVLALIFYQCWRFYILFANPVSIAPDQLTTTFVSQLPAAKNIDIDKLAESQLFGSVAVATPKPQISIEQAPPSTRSYRIASIAYQTANGPSSVVLEVTPGDMTFLRPGDTIEPGVALKDVSADAILLETNGRAERIEYVRVRQPVLIKVTKAARDGALPKSTDDWTWTAKWAQLSAEEIVVKLGLALVDGRYVVTAESPLLGSWNVAESDRLLAVNGKPLVAGKEIKEQLQPLSQPGTVHLLVEGASRRNLVRWHRRM